MMSSWINNPACKNSIAAPARSSARSISASGSPSAHSSYPKRTRIPRIIFPDRAYESSRATNSDPIGLTAANFGSFSARISPSVRAIPGRALWKYASMPHP